MGKFILVHIDGEPIIYNTKYIMEVSRSSLDQNKTFIHFVQKYENDIDIGDVDVDECIEEIYDMLK